ncbi:MFS transporter [Chelonobacter oris]|uniref:MFS transporter n=1 Tax=Chelonobacter oris TaxID=505317 RepID=UPI002449FFCD|nr:MFS transporter [Chelonobacter oris]MDH3001428.1 MFS transporter [Chelonobacter oris]
MNIKILNATSVAFMLFLAIVSLGLSLAVIPLYINKVLSLPAIWVGVAIATESISTLLSRHYSGKYSDIKGPKLAMLKGQSLILIAGFLFFITYILDINNVYISLLIILFSRVIMGVGESLIFTSSGTWPIGLIGREHAGKVMSWVGIAMFIGLALGNYLGGQLFYKYSLLIPSIIMWTLPCISLIIAIYIPKVAVHNDITKIRLSYAVSRIWKAGTGFALANTGYAAITSFLLLFFYDKNWNSYGPIALSLFGIGYVISRLIFSNKTDKMGLKATIISLIIESSGLFLISLSISPIISMLGSFLTGFGLSMIYPLLALPAIKSLPERNIGTAISTYESCFDIGILLSGVLGGILVSSFGYNTLFLFTFFCSLGAIIFSKLAYMQLDNEKTL